MDTATERVVEKMTQDLRPKDQAAQDRIDELESQLDAADIENEELQQAYDALRVEHDAMVKDRTYTP